MTTSLKLLSRYKIDNHESVIWNVLIEMNEFVMLQVPDVQVSMENGVSWLFPLLMKSKYQMINVATQEWT